MMSKKITAAVKARKRKGEVKTYELLRFIEDNSGLSYYEIGKKLEWNPRLVRYYVGKLKNLGLVEVKQGLERGRAVSRVYINENFDFTKILNEEEWSKEEVEMIRRLKGDIKI